MHKILGLGGFKVNKITFMLILICAVKLQLNHSKEVKMGILTEYPYMSQCRYPVVHKLCIRKLNRYLFILKNIVSEKWILEKSLSSLIRRVLPVLLNFFVSIITSFQHRLPKIRKFQH